MAGVSGSRDRRRYTRLGRLPGRRAAPLHRPDPARHHRTRV